MHRFFFNLHEPHGVTLDEEGMELESFEAAFKHAVLAAREVIAEDVRYGGIRLSSYIEITNADAVTLAVVHFPEALSIEP
jgi:hypothetical protein